LTKSAVVYRKRLDYEFYIKSCANYPRKHTNYPKYLKRSIIL